MIVLGIVFAGLSFAASKLLAPQRPTSAKEAPYECGIVPDPRAGAALPRALLPDRDDLRGGRHRDHLPLPLGRGLAEPGPLRPGGDPRVRRLGVRARSSTSSPTAPSTGARSSGCVPIQTEPGREPRRRPCGASGPRAAKPRRRIAAQHGPRGSQPQFPHRLARGAREVGAPLERVAGHLRPGVLRHRDDGGRCRRLRPRPLRHGGVPRLAAPGRPHGRRRPRVAEDGARAAPGLRPDGRAEVGHLDGRVRLDRRHVQQLRHRPGRRPDRPRRRLRAGLPAEPADAHPRHLDPAREDPPRRAHQAPCPARQGRGSTSPPSRSPPAGSRPRRAVRLGTPR